MNKLPEKLYTLRKHYSYSQSYVADHLDIGTFEYMNYENGSKIPPYDELKALAKLYKLSFEELFINDTEIELENTKLDVDKRNYNYLRGEAKKEKMKALFNKNKKQIVIISCLVLVIIALLLLIPKENYEDLGLVMIDNNANTLAASNTSVIYEDSEGNIVGRGDNTYSQLDFEYSDIHKIVMGRSFSIALNRDGTLSYSGLVGSFSANLDRLNNIVDIEAGDSHIVALDSTGRVYCYGNNDYGQCDVNNKGNIKEIYASANATVVVDINDEIITYGDILGFDRFNNLEGIKDMDMASEVIVFVDDTGHLTYHSLTNEFNIGTFKDIVEVAAGNNFIAALDTSGLVSIATEDEDLKEEVESWENVSAIASGDDYLVAIIEGELVGAGNNAYRQFEVYMPEVTTLASVSNIRVNINGDNLVVTFNEVPHASYYSLTISTDPEITLSSSKTTFEIATSNLVDSTRYTIEITAMSTSDRYENSRSSIVNYRYFENREEPLETDEPIISGPSINVGTITGLTPEEFVNLFESFGVDPNNLHRITNSSILCSSPDEVYVIATEGISNNETLTLEDLLERQITYYICGVVEINGEDLAD